MKTIKNKVEYIDIQDFCERNKRKGYLIER